MRTWRFVARGAVLAAGLSISQASLAAVPAHTPGTVCLVPTLWCYLPPPPAQVGAPCYCATTYGNVPGRVG